MVQAYVSYRRSIADHDLYVQAKKDMDFEKAEVMFANYKESKAEFDSFDRKYRYGV